MYTIYADGVCIYNDVFSLDNMRLVSPKLTLEDNAAGSLVMTLPPTNIGYESIVRMVTDIEVRKDGKSYWSGRVLSESKDFWNNRVLTCEGALAFFNDTTQPPAEYSGLSIREFLEKLVEIHNTKVSENRRFIVGAVTVVDEDYPDYRTNYNRTMESINSLIETYGGHMRVRDEDGVRYLDYFEEYPDTATQTIQFGTNLIEFTRDWDATKFATVLVPLGNRLKESPYESLDAYLTVESVNSGSLYIQNEDAVRNYGWIEACVTWENVSDAETLLEKAKEYLADIQFDDLEIELSAVDLHYLNAENEAVNLLDEIRVISRPHGLDRFFPVTKLEIPLDAPEDTIFTLGGEVKDEFTASTTRVNTAILEKIDALPKTHAVLDEAKANATAIMKMATTGFITITQDEYGSETLYISNDRDYKAATKLWKWNMAGLGYSNDGGKTFGLAITMDGSIVADYITTGIMSAERVRTGILQDYGGNVIFDLDKGTLTMKKGSINIGNNFIVDELGNLTARRGTFYGSLVGVTGTFNGTVQAEDFLDSNGLSMLEAGKFKSDYLDLYGLTIRNKSTNAITLQVSPTGVVTINGSVTMGAGSVINWAQVSNTNLTSNPAYSKAVDAYNLADDAYDYADTAYSRAERAYKLANSIDLPSYIQSTYIDSTTIKAPVIEGGEFYGSEFNVIAGGDAGSFNLYGPYGSSRYHMFCIEYYDAGVWGPYIYIDSPCGGTICFSGNVEFTGNVEFAGANVHGITSD